MNQITIEEQLDKDGYVLELSVGNSMKPLINQRTEQLLIEKFNDFPKRKDVVLFKRGSGKLVLHRIISVRKDGFVIRGDNCYKNERVSAEQIIGILKGFYKGDRFVDCDKDIPYRLFVSVWLFSFPLRRFTRYILEMLRAVLIKTRGMIKDNHDVRV